MAFQQCQTVVEVWIGKIAAYWPCAQHILSNLLPQGIMQEFRPRPVCQCTACERDSAAPSMANIRSLKMGKRANAASSWFSKASGQTFVAKCISLAALNEHDQDAWMHGLGTIEGLFHCNDGIKFSAMQCSLLLCVSGSGTSRGLA